MGIRAGTTCRAGAMVRLQLHELREPERGSSGSSPGMTPCGSVAPLIERRTAK
jgi:hypothetical protein